MKKSSMVKLLMEFLVKTVLFIERYALQIFSSRSGPEHILPYHRRFLQHQTLGHKQVSPSQKVTSFLFCRAMDKDQAKHESIEYCNHHTLKHKELFKIEK